MPTISQQSPPPLHCQRLTTEEFFTEFDSNFVVTFDSSPGPQLKHHSEQSKLFSGDSWGGRGSSKQGSVLNAETGEKSSPIPSFAVRHRTVFKSKAKIANAHPSKTTRPQLINHQHLKDFLERPLSHQLRNKKTFST